MDQALSTQYGQRYANWKAAYQTTTKLPSVGASVGGAKAAPAAAAASGGCDWYNVFCMIGSVFSPNPVEVGGEDPDAAEVGDTIDYEKDLMEVGRWKYHPHHHHFHG